MAPLPSRCDAVVVGAGHNGLVAATVLARAGLDVLVLERDRVIGGACGTERPFAAVPELGASTGAYLLGLLPPERARTAGRGWSPTSRWRRSPRRGARSRVSSPPSLQRAGTSRWQQIWSW